MSDINGVKLYNKIGTFHGLLTPISCEVNETINGEDRLTMSCVYDDAHLWMKLLPGARLGVIVTRCAIPAESEIDTLRCVINEYYRVASDASSTARKIYENVESADGGYSFTGKYAATGQEVTIDEYRSRDGVYCVDSIRATTGAYYYNCLIDQDALEIVRDTEEKAFVNMPVSTDEQIYTITDVTFTEQSVSVEAVHRTIDMCSQLIYADRSEYFSDRYATQHELNDTAYEIMMSAFVIDQDRGSLEISCNVNETCVIDTTEWCMNVNAMLTSKLLEMYDYEILRKGDWIHLYEYIGKDRGVVLEVGRNLTSLQIDMSRDGSDMNGVVAYCMSKDGMKLFVRSDIETGTVGNNATRCVMIEDKNAAAIADTKDSARVVNSRLKITAKAYRKSREFKDIGAYTISVRPQLAQIPELWTNTPIALGDIVTIRDPRLPEGELKQRVVQRTQDCLTGLVKTITVCDVPKSMYDVIKQMR